MHKVGRDREALSLFGSAIVASPRHARAHSNRGVVLEQMEDYPDALDAFYAAARLAPTGSKIAADAWSNAGVVLTQLGRIDEATDAFDRALEAEPSHGNALAGIEQAFRVAEQQQGVDAEL